MLSNGSIPRYHPHHNQHQHHNSHHHNNRHSCPPINLPAPPSAANSLRSSAGGQYLTGQSTLYRNSLASTAVMGSTIPLSAGIADSMLTSADDRILVTNNILKDKSPPPLPPQQQHPIVHGRGHEIIETKLSANILPIFIMDFLSLACLSCLAYLLRFTESFAGLQRGFFCDDPTISMPWRPAFGDHRKPPMTGFSDELFYSIIIGVPVLMIIITEILKIFLKSDNYNNIRRKVIAAQSGCITCHIQMPLRRIFRFIGAFAYGLLVTSILTDTLKLVTGRLRPYFLTVCQTIHEICKRLSLENTGIDYETRAPVNYRHVWVDPTDFPDTVLCQNQTSIIRSARMSFPSGTASLSTYSALFIVLYITYAWTARSSRVFKLWFTVTSVICLLIVCAGKVTTHDNHWDDIVAGLVIGIGFALYICYTQLNLFSDLLVSGGSGSGDQPISDTLENQSQMTDDEDDGQWFWRYFHIPRVNLLRRSARYFRKRTAEPNIGCGTGMSSMTPRLGSNSSYVNPAFDHKDHIMDTAGTGGCGGSSSSSSRPHSAYIDTYRRH